MLAVRKSSMANWITLFQVSLGNQHKPTGNTTHWLVGPGGREPFPPFTRLEICQYEGDDGYYLLYYPEKGSGTDTWHKSVEDAMHQAEFEFNVSASDWTNG